MGIRVPGEQQPVPRLVVIRNGDDVEVAARRLAADLSRCQEAIAGIRVYVQVRRYELAIGDARRGARTGALCNCAEHESTGEHEREGGIEASHQDTRAGSPIAHAKKRSSTDHIAD